MQQHTVRSLRLASAVLIAALLVLAGLGIYAASRQGMEDDVMVCGDFRLSNTQLAYYYWSEYFYFAGAYGEYLDGVVDLTVPLDQQAYSDEQTWQDYLLDEALSTVRETMAMVFRAQEEGFTLSAQGEADLAEVLESFRTAAEENGYADLEAYLAASYGPGATEESFTDYLRCAHLAAEYADSLFEAIAPTEAEIREYYEAHAGEYLENYGVTREDGPMPHGVYLPFDSWGEAQAVYDDFLEGGATHDLLNNLGAANLGQTGELEEVTPDSVGEAAEAWFYDESRQSGDHAVVTGEDGSAAICYFVSAGQRTYWQRLAEDDLRHETYQNQYLTIVNAYTFYVNYDKIRITAPEGLYETQSAG